MIRQGNPKRLTPDKLLSAVLHKNTSVREERRGGGAVLWAPLVRRWWMRPPFSWVFRFGKDRGFSLDRLGLEVWDACDGKRTLEQIIDAFSARHRVSFHEARYAVMQFVRELVKRDLLAVEIERSEAST